MGHEKKKKRDRDRDRDRSERRRRSRSRSASGAESGAEGATSERRHRRRHKKHRSSRHRRRSSGSLEAISPTPLSPAPAAAGEQPAQPQAATREAESLSIEDTNKLRLKLGLKPLSVSGAPAAADGGDADAPKLGSSDRTAIHAKPENMGEKKRTERLRERLREKKEQRALEARLGRARGLGESDSDQENAADWVAKSRRVQAEREQARKRAALLDDLDAEFGVGELVSAEAGAAVARAYTAADLRGLTVQHAAGALAEGRTTVLTLQDAGVLDDQAQDVLVNVNIADDERAKKNSQLRRQKPGYRADDDDEWDDQGNFRPRSLLSKYDEELFGEQKQAFTLGAGGVSSGVSSAEAAGAAREKLQMGVKRSLQSLEMPAPQPQAEFFTESEMATFKKVKKKVRKVRSRALRADDLLDGAEQAGAHLGSRRRGRPAADGQPMQTTEPAGEILVSTDDTEPPPADLSSATLQEEPDDDLERAIERSRRLRHQHREQEEPMSGEVQLAAMAARLREEPDGPASSSRAAPSQRSIVLNSTAEFCRSLGDIPTYGMAGNRAAADAADAAALERELAEDRRRAEQQALLEQQGGGTWEEVSGETPSAPADLNLNLAGTSALQSEPEIGSGLAGALQLALNKGYVDQDASGKKGASKQVLAHLRAQNYSIEDKSGTEDQDRRGRGGNAYNGPVTEFREKQNYAPAIKLEYIDDQGRLLSSKEAFRYLSHKFHGKGSGKMKTEKREKKFAEELAMARMSSADTPLHTLERLQNKQKQLASPFVVLSGNRALTAESGSQVSKH